MRPPAPPGSSSSARRAIPSDANPDACPASTTAPSGPSTTSDWYPSVWPGVGTAWTPGHTSASPSGSSYRAPGKSTSASIVYPPALAAAGSRRCTRTGGTAGRRVAPAVVEALTAVDGPPAV
ncbi:hypothetical protein [Streptomyces fradiae]|uniref:hypothetical protein n=1 Tax=Streptomyces fradiae TaxID=1906 RepID=UPI0036BDEBBE